MKQRELKSRSVVRDSYLRKGRQAEKVVNMLKKFQHFKIKKQVTFLSLLLALAVAVFLNWQYARNDGDYRMIEEEAVMTDLSVLTMEETQDEVTEEELQRNYGDAQLVSLSKQESLEYFEDARLSRDKSRDEALEKMEKTLKDAQLSEEEKAELTKTLSDTISSITVEDEIESLAKAKGFVDCIVYIDGESADMAVMTKNNTLTQQEVMQLRDIIMSKTEIEAKNIKIVEVK